MNMCRFFVTVEKLAVFPSEPVPSRSAVQCSAVQVQPDDC